MGQFEVRNGELHAEGLSIRAIAESVGTPFYCYSTATMERQYTEFADAFAAADATVLYSVKANSNISVIRTFGRLGAGADVVSGGEMQRALVAGVPAERIVFSGVGKTRAELAEGLQTGVRQFNVESEGELTALAEVARSRGSVASVAIRVNPNIDAASHDKITTGRSHDKFGITWEHARHVYSEAAKMPSIRITGLAVHIGSQIESLKPFASAFRAVAELAAVLKGDGHDIVNLDLGGGLGIRYGNESPPTPQEYANVAIRETAGTGCRLFLEPGRVLVGSAGILVTEVLYEKAADGQRVVVVDAAMNDLIRPAMYGAQHEIVAVTPVIGAVDSPADVVGPVCESSDRFARNRPLPPVMPGDLLAIATAGAYGAVMASTYNSRLLVPEVLVNKHEFAVIRPRPEYEDLIGADVPAPWLA